MIGRNIQIREPTAPWSARISLFALTLIAIAFVLHRVALMATPVALNLFGAGFILAALGFSVGLYAATSIWVRGRVGAWSCAWGLLVAALIWVWPAALVPTYLSLPKIHDISTNTANPPPFTVLAKERLSGANSATYPGAASGSLQAQAYPDLRTLVIPRSAEEVYELTLDLIRGRRGLGWKVVAEEAPQPKGARPGFIEATDRTLVLGFTDDIAIRISGTDNEARLDIRSASRYGAHDFGGNASRIRRFVVDLSKRLDAAGPVGMAARGGVRVNSADLPTSAVRRPLDRKSEKEARKR